MKTRETELFFKSLFLNLTILNVVFYLNVWINPTVLIPDNLIVDRFQLFFNLSWVLTQFVFFRKTFYFKKSFIYRFERISSQMFVFCLISALSLFFITTETFKISFILGYWISFYGAEVVVTFFFFTYLRLSYAEESKLNRIFIVGFNQTGQFFQKIIANNPALGYKFIGYISNEWSTNPNVIGQSDRLASLIEKHNIQTIFVVQSNFHEFETNYFYSICDNKGVRLWWITNNYQVNKCEKKTIDRVMLINPKEIPLDNLKARFFKRSFDIVFSLSVILIVLSWLFPLLAIIIKLDSKGPVFFIQKRTGFNNVVFNCYKFRTMCVNDKADILQAKNNDTRITGIGKFLRKTNIDEFPQFFNVLLGQMSVVGPRPHMLKHTEEYSTLIKGYLRRHFVKPGITGWAQVNGLHGETDALWKMEKRVEYDIHYMNNWTFWLDVKIVPMTVFNKRKYLRLVDINDSSKTAESVLSESNDYYDLRQS